MMGFTDRQQAQRDAATEALTEMVGKIKLELGLDPQLAEAAALRSAYEIMGMQPDGHTLAEQAELLLVTMGFAPPKAAPPAPPPPSQPPQPTARANAAESYRSGRPPAHMSPSTASTPSAQERAPPPQPKGLKLKLSREGEREHTTLLHPPDGTFGELLAAYCAQAGLPPAGYRLQFDGDTLAPAGTPADADMEDGDLVEVVKAR